MNSQVNACNATNVRTMGFLFLVLTSSLAPSICMKVPRKTGIVASNPIWKSVALSARANGIARASPKPSMPECAMPSIIEARRLFSLRFLASFTVL